MPDPDKQAADVDLDALIEKAVEKVVESTKPADTGADPEPPQAPEPPPQVDYNELFAEGRYDEAIAAMKQEALREASKLAGPALLAAHENAKQLAKEKLGDKFDKWAPKALDLAKQYNIDPRGWVTVEDWERAIKHAMAANLDELLEEERAKAREEALRAAAAAAVSPGSIGLDDSARDAYAQLTDEAREAVRKLGWDPETVAKQWDLIEKHTGPDGAIVELTVIDDDLKFNEEGQPIEIEPGRF